MKIIEISDDQNTVKTDEGKEHEFVKRKLVVCSEVNCSLLELEYSFNCTYLCCKSDRKDHKSGYFKLK